MSKKKLFSIEWSTKKKEVSLYTIGDTFSNLSMDEATSALETTIAEFSAGLALLKAKQRADKSIEKLTAHLGGSNE